jgi:Fur family ferric uptake transcriptional regulator
LALRVIDGVVFAMSEQIVSKNSDESTDWFWDELGAYLARNQLKQTKQRNLIVEQFLTMEGHLDAEGLHERLRNLGYPIGLATVYRTLNLLKDAGLVEQQSFADGRSVFEVQFPCRHHDHLVCLDCGRIVEFENQEIEALQEQIAKSFGFSLSSHRLDLYGKCTKKQCVYKKNLPS